MSTQGDVLRSNVALNFSRAQGRLYTADTTVEPRELSRARSGCCSQRAGRRGREYGGKVSEGKDVWLVQL